MSEQNKKKPFAILRVFHWADWFTLGNAICGTAAIFSMVSFVQTGIGGHVHLACSLLFAVSDGRIARRRRPASLRK
jgi:CDP-diacylglycerol--serine O-phosphatidyltransferase